MGFWDKLRGELIDIIEWLDESRNTMVYRFERYGNEIKYGAKLVVREGQAAAFIDQGRLADVFEPGMYTLETKNLPILSTLQGWKYGFESPFKAEVYFVSTRNFTDLKWGTKNPVMMRDPEFGPVRLRAFGTYAIRVKDPAAFLRQIVGTNQQFTTEHISDFLRDMIVARFADLLGESRIPVLDLASNYDELGQFVAQRIGPAFIDYGLEITRLLIENVSLPPEVEAAMDKRTSMGIVGNLQAYTQFQAANAMEQAANNPSGLAGGGVGMGMGFAMANQMGQAMRQSNDAAPPAPPPVPTAAQYYLVLNGQQAGPFDAGTLRQYVQGGQLTRETLVWKPGMPDWMPAAQAAELTMLFGPPPVPPPPAQ